MTDSEVVNLEVGDRIENENTIYIVRQVFGGLIVLHDGTVYDIKNPEDWAELITCWEIV